MAWNIKTFLYLRLNKTIYLIIYSFFVKQASLRYRKHALRYTDSLATRHRRRITILCIKTVHLKILTNFAEIYFGTYFLAVRNRKYRSFKHKFV